MIKKTPWSPGDHLPECASHLTFMVGGILTGGLGEPGAHEVRHVCNCAELVVAAPDSGRETPIQLKMFDISGLWEGMERFDTEVKIAMPGSHEATRLLGIVYERLRALGWRNMPSDAAVKHRKILGIELGVIIPTEMHYMLDGWWVEDMSGDQWPAHPILWRHIDNEDPDD